MTADDTTDEWVASISDTDDRHRYRWHDSERPSLALAEAVADATDRDPTGLSPLYEYIDVDALNRLLTRQADERVRVSFVYDGVPVRIDSAGRIDVQPDS